MNCKRLEVGSYGKTRNKQVGSYGTTRNKLPATGPYSYTARRHAGTGACVRLTVSAKKLCDGVTANPNIIQHCV